MDVDHETNTNDGGHDYMTTPDEQFYVGQKAAIRKGSEVLILHDPDPAPGNIDLPGGKIQLGERDFAAAIKREVFEETGLSISVGRPFFTSYWEFPDDSVHRNKGKKIFLVFYECTYVSGEVRLSEEHDEYRWVNKENYASFVEKGTNIFQALSTFFNLN